MAIEGPCRLDGSLHVAAKRGLFDNACHDRRHDEQEKDGHERHLRRHCDRLCLCRQPHQPSHDGEQGEQRPKAEKTGEDGHAPDVAREPVGAKTVSPELL
jgi:hypothetical protein